MDSLKAVFYKHTLNFTFDAGTSRGVLKNKTSYFIKIWEESSPNVFGIGEAGPLKDLSLDFETAENFLKSVVESINNKVFTINNFDEIIKTCSNNPSVCFALEIAIKDLINGGKRLIFKNDFVNNSQLIPINGLVWMNTAPKMLEEVHEKVKAGFNVIKLKVGAIDFDEELKLLTEIRKVYTAEQIELRLDANGAFKSENALEKLEKLSKFTIHSIEQPIAAGKYEEMAEICLKSPIPVALDEELIGQNHNKHQLLNTIKPKYIILKPSLIGGIKETDEWIKTAESLAIAWWLTSALESNIGLNAIAQLAANYKSNMPQGLGTGKLYHNNLDSPLSIDSGFIKYDTEKKWDLSLFDN